MEVPVNNNENDTHWWERTAGVRAVVTVIASSDDGPSREGGARDNNTVSKTITHRVRKYTQNRIGELQRPHDNDRMIHTGEKIRLDTAATEQ